MEDWSEKTNTLELKDNGKDFVRMILNGKEIVRILKYELERRPGNLYLNLKIPIDETSSTIDISKDVKE